LSRQRQRHAIDTIEVHGGVYDGRLEIHRPLTLIGHDWPVIDGGGVGNVVPHCRGRSRHDHHRHGYSQQRPPDQPRQLRHCQPGGQYLIIGNRLEDTLFGINLRFGSGSRFKTT
jgi:hypothetical protein